MAYLLSFLILSLFSIADAQIDGEKDPNNFFIYPPAAGKKWAIDHSVYESNLVWDAGTDQPLQWQSNISIILRLVQEGEANNQKLLSSNTRLQSYYWDGNITGGNFNPSKNVFFFGAWDASAPDSGYVFLSHYINITTKATTTSSSAGPSSPVSSSVLMSPTATPSPTQGGSSSSLSNVAARAGGIGGGIGGALLIIGAVILFLYLRKTRQRGTDPSATAPDTSQFKHAPSYNPHQSYQSYQLDEMSPKPDSYALQHSSSYGGGQRHQLE